MRYRAPRFRRVNVKKIAAVAAPILVVVIVLAIVLAKAVIPGSRYRNAVALYDAGKYDEALAAFSGIKGYKDSAEFIEKCYIGGAGEEKYNAAKSIGIGDTYVFGTYEQDNDLSNGKEEIEWIVLDKEGMSLLLLSKYALVGREYHTPRMASTWETCNIRPWLNETFLNEAFSPEEQSRIISAR